MGKSITHRAWLRALAARILAGYLRLVAKGCGLKIHGNPHGKACTPGPLIVAFWHNRMALAPMAWNNPQPFFMMISDHPDGKIISQVVKHFSIDTLEVSRHRDKRSNALKEALRHLRLGHAVGITPDGPRGPCYHAQRGIFITALTSGCDVLVLSYATSHRWRFKSWDRFFFPLPLGQGHVMWGERLAAPTHKHEEAEFLKRLTTALNQTTDRVHDLAGIPRDSLD